MNFKKSNIGPMKIPPMQQQGGASMPVLNEQPASTGVFQEQPASTGVFQETPASTGVFQEVPASTGVFQETPASTGVFAEQPASTGVFQEQPASTGVFSEAPASTGVFQEQPASVGVFQEQPASTGLLNEQPASTGLLNEQPASTGVLQEQPASTGVLQEQAASTGVLTEQPASTSVFQEQPSSITVHDQAAEQRGIIAFDLNQAERTELNVLNTKMFGWNGVSNTREFHFEEVAAEDGTTLDGAIVPGYKTSTGSTEGEIINDTMTDVSSSGLFGTWDQDKSGIHLLGISLLIGVDSLSAAQVPTRIKLDGISVGANTAVADQGVINIFVPKSTIVAPVNIIDNTDSTPDTIIAIGPIYIPFVVNATDEVADTIVATTHVTDDKLSITPAFAKDNGGSYIKFLEAAVTIDVPPAAHNDGSATAVLGSYTELPAVYSNTDEVDTVLENYITVGSVRALLDSASYEHGWEATYANTSGSPVNIKLFNSLTLELDITCIGGLAKTTESSKTVGAALIRADIASLSGDIASTVVYNETTETKHVFFVNPEFIYAGVDLDGTATPASRKYVYEVPGSDIAICVCSMTDTNSSLDASRKHWLAIRRGVSPSYTYHHPANLHQIFGSLVAGEGPDCDITIVRVLADTTNEFAAIVTYHSMTCLLHARTAETFSGGAFLVDSNERSKWIVSQYILGDGIYDGYSASWCDTSDGFLSQSIGEEVAPEGNSLLDIHRLSQVRRPVWTLLAGNRFAVDTVSGMTFSRQLDIGSDAMFFLPWPADRAVFAFRDGVNYAANGLCIPTLLPTITVGRPGGICDNLDWQQASAGTLTIDDKTATASLVHWFVLHINNLATRSSTTRRKYYHGQSAYVSCSDFSAVTGVVHTPTRSTRIIVTTPAITTGGVYASLPATLASIAGADILSSGIGVGDRICALGNTSYVPYNGRLYQSATFPLMPKFDAKMADISGTVETAGNMLFVSDGDGGLSIFAFADSYGLQHVASAACTPVSNFAVIGGSVYWVASDGIWAMLDRRIQRVYRFASTYAPIVGCIIPAGEAFVAHTASAAANKAYVLSDGGIYESTVPTNLHEYSLLRFDYGMTSQARLLKNGDPLECKPIVLDAVSTDVGVLETNHAIVARGHMKFVLQGIRILYKMGGSSTPNNFNIYAYIDGSSSAAYTYTKAGVAPGTYVLNVNTGVYSCTAVKLKFTDVSRYVEIYDIRLLGYYSPAIYS